MSIEEEEIVGSQPEDSEERGSSDDNMDDVLSAFGIEKEEGEEKSFNDKPPAKEEVKPEPKLIKVKHNKEEIEVDVSDDKIPEYVQKSLALDKERERKTELERNLDRAAKLAGYKDHTEYVANFDKMEQQQQEQEKSAYNELRQDLRQQAEDAGLDPDKVEQYLDNHPLMKEAQEAIQERDASRVAQETQTYQQTVLNQWQELYTAFPDLIEDSQAFDKGEAPTFYTESMQAMINQGYKPIDAYRLAHMDKIQTKTVKASQQRLIKEQQLGLRSQVETTSAPDNEKAVPDALANAFAAFGLPVDSAKQYMK